MQHASLQDRLALNALELHLKQNNLVSENSPSLQCDYLALIIQKAIGEQDLQATYRQLLAFIHNYTTILNAVGIELARYLNRQISKEQFIQAEDAKYQELLDIVEVSPIPKAEKDVIVLTLDAINRGALEMSSQNTYQINEDHYYNEGVRRKMFMESCDLPHRPFTVYYKAQKSA